MKYIAYDPEWKQKNGLPVEYIWDQEVGIITYINPDNLKQVSVTSANTDAWAAITALEWTPVGSMSVDSVLDEIASAVDAPVAGDEPLCATDFNAWRMRNLTLMGAGTLTLGLLGGSIYGAISKEKSAFQGMGNGLVAALVISAVSLPIRYFQLGKTPTDTSC